VLAAKGMSRRKPADGVDLEGDVVLVRMASPLAGNVVESGSRRRDRRGLAVADVAEVIMATAALASQTDRPIVPPNFAASYGKARR